MLWLDLTGLDRAQSALQRMLSQGQNLRPLLLAIGEAESFRVTQRFEDSRAPDGTLWSSLKVRQGKPLQDTGALKASLQTQLLGQGQAVAGVQIGTDLIYAATHQFGRGTIPARPFLGVTPELEADILAKVREHFNL